VIQKPVSVLAQVDLLILSTNTYWEPGSKIRGGCYVWALDPLKDQIFYFAHLKEVQVQGGAFIKARSVVGTVGRTGTNAWPARSPTHLHFMVLTVTGAALVPFDYRDQYGR
jgi:peptidoglycan LD-endopeptidase LytH